MTPAEHYAEAERLAKLAVGDFPADPIEQSIVALAQVHATLASCDPDVIAPVPLGAPRRRQFRGM